MRKEIQVKVVQEILLKKENEIIRETMLYCSKNNIEFSKKHNTLMRNAMRVFFTNGVYPIVRDLFDTNVKKYSD
jgi:hypothetical protein